MFIFDRIVFATAWHASLLQTVLLCAVVDEDEDDVVVEVVVDVVVEDLNYNINHNLDYNLRLRCQ